MRQCAAAVPHSALLSAAMRPCFHHQAKRPAVYVLRLYTGAHNSPAMPRWLVCITPARGPIQLIIALGPPVQGHACLVSAGVAAVTQGPGRGAGGAVGHALPAVLAAGVTPAHAIHVVAVACMAQQHSRQVSACRRGLTEQLIYTSQVCTAAVAPQLAPAAAAPAAPGSTMASGLV
jgi:hypothetical protein